MEKKCCRCKEIKPAADFAKRACEKDGLERYCRLCIRNLAAKRLYGSVDDNSSFTGSCDICDKPIQGKNKHRDHSHTSGETRGWLCHSCNVGLGHFQDDPELLGKAIAYLEHHSK